MAILSVDASSTKVAWAVLSSEESLSARGVIRAEPAQPIETRMQPVLEELVDIAKRCHCHTVVIEHSYGKSDEQTRFFAKDDLAKYAQAVGQVIQRLIDLGFNVRCYGEQEWSGPWDKQRRAERVEELFPDEYSRENDRSLQQADAIGLGLWWLKQLREVEQAAEKTEVPS